MRLVVGEVGGEVDELEAEEDEDGVGDGGCEVSMRGWGSDESLLAAVGEGGGRLAGVVDCERARELSRPDKAAGKRGV